MARALPKTTTERRRRSAPAGAKVMPFAHVDSPVELVEAQVAEAVRLAADVTQTGTQAYRALAERLVDLRVALDDLDGQGTAYKEARHRAFYTAGVKASTVSAQIERNVRYHVSEVLAARGLREREPARARARRAKSAADQAAKALEALRKVRIMLEAEPEADDDDRRKALDALDEVGAVMVQIRRRLGAQPA